MNPACNTITNSKMQKKYFRLAAIITFFILCQLPQVAYSETYKWRDENGQLHFGDKPPEGKKADRIEIDTSKQSVYKPVPYSSEGFTSQKAEVKKKNNSNVRQPQKETPDLNALLKIKLPQNPTKRQVREYIQKILIESRNQRSYLAADPQVSMLIDVGAEHIDVLVEATTDNVPWTRYPVEAITQLATERDKSLVLSKLRQKKKLSTVVYHKDWSADARDILISGLKNYTGYVPYDWIRALASLQDPASYAVLKAYMENGWNRHSTYRIIKTLPDINLNQSLQKAWENSRSTNNKYETGYLTSDVIGTGYMPALKFTVDMLDTNYDIPTHVFNARLVALRYLDTTGDNHDIRQWFYANQSRISFDSVSGKYRVFAPGS